MSEDRDDNENFFEKFGMEIGNGEVEVGKTYPIYGMITKIIDDTPGNVIVEINFNIEATMMIEQIDKVQLLKDRAFEPGIFISLVKEKLKEKTIVDCSTVVFGKKPKQIEN